MKESDRKRKEIWQKGSYRPSNSNIETKCPF